MPGRAACRPAISTSTTTSSRCRAGSPAHDELRALAATLGAAGHGILQVVHEFYDTAKTVERVDMLADLSLEYGIPTTLAPLFHNQRAPEMVPTVLGRIEEQARRGARVWPQVQTRPIDINFRLRERNFMLAALPTWGRVFGLPDLQQKIDAFSDPGTRARLVSEATAGRRRRRARGPATSSRPRLCPRGGQAREPGSGGAATERPGRGARHQPRSTS